MGALSSPYGVGIVSRRPGFAWESQRASTTNSRYNHRVSQTINQFPGQVRTESPSSSDFLPGVVTRIERDLEQRLGEAKIPENLAQAVRYAVLGPGKRLRPVLALLCCRAVGGEDGDALAAAAAIELIHTFSLVHDDLPAMDDDSLRRGRPTLHIHAGEAMAVLAGDVMVSLAFEFISQADLDQKKRIELTSELAQATTAMIAGQVYDTLGGFELNMSDRQRLQIIHRHKTSALIRASCRMGAICGNAGEGQLQMITRYGDAIGLMFQIVDDLLDVTQSAEHTGKATGKDHSAGKLTFPGVVGVAGSRQEIARLHEQAVAALSELGPAAQPLRELCDRLAVRTR